MTIWQWEAREAQALLPCSLKFPVHVHVTTQPSPLRHSVPLTAFILWFYFVVLFCIFQSHWIKRDMQKNDTQVHCSNFSLCKCTGTFSLRKFTNSSVFVLSSSFDHVTCFWRSSFSCSILFSRNWVKDKKKYQEKSKNLQLNYSHA